MIRLQVTCKIEIFSCISSYQPGKSNPIYADLSMILQDNGMGDASAASLAPTGWTGPTLRVSPLFPGAVCHHYAGAGLEEA